MNHADLAAFAELQICNFKHWRSVSWGRPGAWRLNSHLLGIRVQNNRCYFERGRKLKRGNLEWHRDKNRCPPLSRWCELDGRGIGIAQHLQSPSCKCGETTRRS